MDVGSGFHCLRSILFLFFFICTARQFTFCNIFMYMRINVPLALAAMGISLSQPTTFLVCLNAAPEQSPNTPEGFRQLSRETVVL
jgi:hypothetical protein